MLLVTLGPLTLVAQQVEIPQAPRALRWEQLPALPVKNGLAGVYTGVSRGALLVAGGTNSPRRAASVGEGVVHDRIYVLPDAGHSWLVAETALPAPSAYGCSYTHGDAVVCVGGQDQRGPRAEAFTLTWDPARRDVRIRSLPPLPRPVAFASGTRDGDTLYVLGGRGNSPQQTPQSHFWSLDLSPSGAPAEWVANPSWPGLARWGAAAAVRSESLYLIGGASLVAEAGGSPQTELLSDGFRYDLATRSWSQIAAMPEPCSQAAYPAPTLGNSHLLIVGGRRRRETPSASSLETNLLAYDAITDTWVGMGRLPSIFKPDTAQNLRTDNASLAAAPTTWWQGRLVVVGGEVEPDVFSSRAIWAEPVQRSARFAALDYVAVVAYLGVLVWIGVHFSRTKRNATDFFLGGRRIPWWAAGISIYGTQISAVSFMSLPALVYRDDWRYLLGVGAVLVGAPVVVHCYLPFYRQLEVTSAYEYLEERFNLATRLVASGIFLLGHLAKNGVIVFLPSLALSTVTGIDVYLCIIVIGVLATLYTVLGGIEAVVWTDVLQVAVLLGATIVCLGIVFVSVEGGLWGVLQLGAGAGKLRTVDLGWDATRATLWVVVGGRFFQYLVPSTADQTVVQRYLTTVDERAAGRAIYTNAVLLLPTTFLFFLLGTSLWAFYRCHPEQLNPHGHTDEIYARFIAEQLPVGLSGLVIAGLFAAAMSSLDSGVNSMATIITTDFYRRFRPAVTDRHCLSVARWLTAILGLAGTVSALIMALLGSTSMWEQVVKLTGLFGGGLAGLFAAGIFTRRIHAGGALTGFFCSAVLLSVVSGRGLVHFFLYAAVAVASCLLVAYAVSTLFPQQQRDLAGLTVHTLRDRGQVQRSD